MMVNRAAPDGTEAVCSTMIPGRLGWLPGWVVPSMTTPAGSSSIGKTSVRRINQTPNGVEYPGSLVGIAKWMKSLPALLLASKMA